MSQLYDITASALQEANYRPLHAGDDYDHKFTLKKNSLPVDLTGAKVWLTVKESALDTDAQAKLQLISTSNTEIEITNPTQGEFTVKFRGSGLKTTENLAGLWLYDIQVKLAAPANTVITVATGKIEFLENLTRSTA